mmetsp:Transcript_848/g.2739  ORF Transcript_848/g.2739 Transcript_848/m.2739 type:complete len:262 (-) Transcript_848:526-1311(-)
MVPKLHLPVCATRHHPKILRQHVHAPDCSVVGSFVAEHLLTGTHVKYLEFPALLSYDDVHVRLDKPTTEAIAEDGHRSQTVASRRIPHLHRASRRHRHQSTVVARQGQGSNVAPVARGVHTCHRLQLCSCSRSEIDFQHLQEVVMQVDQKLHLLLRVHKADGANFLVCLYGPCVEEVVNSLELQLLLDPLVGLVVAHPLLLLHPLLPAPAVFFGLTVVPDIEKLNALLDAVHSEQATALAEGHRDAARGALAMDGAKARQL